MSILVLSILFFIVSIIYASGGFGGGSSYIAILLLANLPIHEVRYLALICNIVVVSSACAYFYKNDLLPIKKTIPLVILSIPLALLGGTFTPAVGTYKIIAAIALILAGMMMLYPTNQTKNKLTNNQLTGIGGGIGLLSGFVGIGGGIFLSPVLHICKWESARTISAAASFFIVINSIAGLIGQSLHRPPIDYRLCFTLAIVVLVGGRIGNLINIKILQPNTIKVISAALVIFVGVRLILIEIL